MHKLLKQAFTLIELLVVIAIIGILSGLIVISMNGITQKATIAKAQIFSNSLKNSLMTNLISEWKLDGNGNDSWGTNNGTVNGATPISSDCIYGSCLSFNGSSNYIEFSDINSVENIDTLTISAWVYSNPSGSYRTVISKGYYTSGSWELRMSRDDEGPGLGFSVVTNNGRVGSRIPDFKNSMWHNIVCIYNGSKTYIYDNSVLVDSDIQTGNIVDTTNTVKIGQNGVNDEYWFGKLDEIRIYDSAILLSQIKEQYYAGLNSLLTKGGIDKQEYQNRVGVLTIAE